MGRLVKVLSLARVPSSIRGEGASAVRYAFRHSKEEERGF